MKRLIILLVLFSSMLRFSYAQHYGDFPKLDKERLLNDLDILYQGLDKFHSGMYWYTPKDSVDIAFEEVRKQIKSDLNILEFYKLIAPLVSLTREDHTDVHLPRNVKEKLSKEARFLPLTVIFLGEELYCLQNASDFENFALEGKRIDSINGETPRAIVEKIGNLFASDGYIKTVKYSDLKKFNFAKYYFYYYGELDEFEIKLKDTKQTIILKALKDSTITQTLEQRYPVSKKNKDFLEYKILDNSTAYLGIHTFSNTKIKEESKHNSFSSFLAKSFESIHDNKISTLIIDVSDNGGGTEGNEGLLYSYLGENYQKYSKVRAKTQKAILDNGVDKVITLKTFGFFERVFSNKKMENGSYERKAKSGEGLMAYQKEPNYKFKGKIYVIISPITYSGGSEFSNMMYTNDLATFVGQETGGGYRGNTSGYSKELVLPNSKIEIDIPALQFMMNVKPKEPNGRGVIPHHQVIPTFEEYVLGENASLKFILEQLEVKK